MTAGGIVGLVRNTASQTNLLALNATIEAISSAVGRVSQAVGTTKEATLVLAR